MFTFWEKKLYLKKRIKYAKGLITLKMATLYGWSLVLGVSCVTAPLGECMTEDDQYQWF